MARGFQKNRGQSIFGARESAASLSAPTKTNLRRRLYRYAGADYEDDSSYSYGRKQELAETLSKLSDRILKNLSVPSGTKIFRGASDSRNYDQLMGDYSDDPNQAYSFSTSVKDAKLFGKKIYTLDDLESYKAAISMEKLFKWLGMTKDLDDLPDDVRREVFVLDAKWKEKVDSSSWKKEERERRSKLR